MLLIICAWFYCFFLILSIGAGVLKLIARFTGLPSQFAFGVFYKFWFGFALLIGILQVLSLFLPLNIIAFIIISAIGFLFAALNFKSVLYTFRMVYHRIFTVKGLVALAGIVMLLLLVSYSANKEVTHTDTLLYHFNAVKWAKEYSVVPGLVNLHGRLGFNSSFFLFAAFTEVGVYADHSAHVALSFLMVVCLIHWSFIIANRKELMPKRIFCMVTFPFLVIHMAARIDIASLSSDYPMAILTLVFCSVLLDRLKYNILLLLPLAAAVFTIKLTGMIVIAISMLLLIVYLLVIRHENKAAIEVKTEKRSLAIALALFTFIVAGFVVRNAIVSGWLIYPFPVGNLHLPWSVPKDYVTDMMDWIKSFPKIPGGASPTTIKEHTFFYWFTQWFPRFRLTMEFNMFVGSVVILVWSLIQVPSFGKFIYPRLNLLVVLLFFAASIVFWFMSAPDIRFGSIYFFMFLGSSVALLYEVSKNKNVLRILISAVLVYEIVVQIPSYDLNVDPNLFTFAYTKPLKLQRVIASPPDENPPLYIYMPLQGNQCGNSPLPCTPYAGGLLHKHQFLKQRVPGDISKGFLPIVAQ